MIGAAVGQLENPPGQVEALPLRELFIITVAEAERHALPTRREEHELDSVDGHIDSGRRDDALAPCDCSIADVAVCDEESAALQLECVIHLESRRHNV